MSSISSIKCEVCGLSVVDGANLHRQNEKGVTGIWRCDKHNALPVCEVAQILIDDMNRRKK